MSQYPADTQIASNFGPSLKEEQQKYVYPRNMFLGTGILLLMMICLVPAWNAFALMSHFNYGFWVGLWLPTWMLVLCLGILILYAIIVVVVFHKAKPQPQTEQTMMVVANIFVSLLGMVLMLMSMPLSRQAVDTYSNLMYRCGHGIQTQRLYEYSQVLHNIRSTPGCAMKYTVEECPGYEEVPPYTTFLKEMEGTFRCSGFCHHPSGGATLLETKQVQTTLHAEGQHLRNRAHHQDHITPQSLGPPRGSGSAGALLMASSGAVTGTFHALGQQPAAIDSAVLATSKYPPTLFSDANYQVSCEGMAARDIKNFAGDLGSQTFYQGIYLLLISIATGFAKLMGLCTSRGSDLKVGRGY